MLQGDLRLLSSVGSRLILDFLLMATPRLEAAPFAGSSAPSIRQCKLSDSARLGKYGEGR